jgi:hypothetical protein
MAEDKVVKVGDTAYLYVAGCRYVHEVVEVLSPKAVVVVQQGSNGLIGPRETITLRKGGRWVEKGKGPNSGWYYIDTHR